MCGEFDPKQLMPLSDDSELVPLEARLVSLIEEISKYDERLAHIEQARAKYRKLVEESPHDKTLADEVRDLGADLALLIENRGYLVKERQDVRDQIRALAGSPQPHQSPTNHGAKTELQARIEGIAKRGRENNKDATPEIGIQPELNFLADMEAENSAEKAKAKQQTEDKPEAEKAGLTRVRHSNRASFWRICSTTPSRMTARAWRPRSSPCPRNQISRCGAGPARTEVDRSR